MSEQLDMDFDVFFSRLRAELEKYGVPVVTRMLDELEDSAFVVLISCLLSLRTKDEVTAAASKRLLKENNSPDKMLELSEEKIASLIYPVGFYRTKAKRILEICNDLIERFDGRVPDSMDELLSLNGVGRKTANIVLVYGHKKHGFLPIDTHCHRIPNRLGWIETKTPEETEFVLLELLPERFWDEFNDLFVTFGQKICLPISPFCSKCPVEGFCKKRDVKTSR